MRCAVAGRGEPNKRASILERNTKGQVHVGLKDRGFEVVDVDAQSPEFRVEFVGHIPHQSMV